MIWRADTTFVVTVASKAKMLSWPLTCSCGLVRLYIYIYILLFYRDLKLNWEVSLLAARKPIIIMCIWLKLRILWWAVALFPVLISCLCSCCSVWSQTDAGNLYFERCRLLSMKPIYEQFCECCVSFNRIAFSNCWCVILAVVVVVTMCCFSDYDVVGGIRRSDRDEVCNDHLLWACLSMSSGTIWFHVGRGRSRYIGNLYMFVVVSVSAEVETDRSEVLVSCS